MARAPGQCINGAVLSANRGLSHTSATRQREPTLQLRRGRQNASRPRLRGDEGGEVCLYTHEIGNAAARIAHGGKVQEIFEGGAVLAVVDELRRARAPVLDSVTHLADHTQVCARPLEQAAVAAHQLTPLVARHFAEGLRGENDGVVLKGRIGDHKGALEAAECVPQCGCHWHGQVEAGGEALQLQLRSLGGTVHHEAQPPFVGRSQTHRVHRQAQVARHAVRAICAAHAHGEAERAILVQGLGHCMARVIPTEPILEPIAAELVSGHADSVGKCFGHLEEAPGTRVHDGELVANEPC
mmetsp:Transcript_3556/g.10104  ORF Transcript_3556/g.10104 Transcript_3556/m.10104 type:complete len:298 (+) Transcript_3556:396-1289(+)